MRKKLMLIGLMTVILLSSCGKEESTEEETETVTEEILIQDTVQVTEEKTSEPVSEEIISSGSNTEEVTEGYEDPADALEGIAFNRKRKLPNIVEPLPDARGFNPRIVNADLFEVGEYYRKELGQEIYMLLEYRNIQEDPTEIELISRDDSSGIAKFQAILKFEKHEDLDIEICYYDYQYAINEPVPDDYQSYEEGEPFHLEDGAEVEE